MYQVAAGGGGVSAFIAKPGWQKGVGVPGDGFRDVPDVSFTAADHDGYLGCFAAGGGSCVSTSSGTEITVFSGTSAAAPGMAGIAALLNTRMGGAQGNLNSMLYRLAASTPTVFHDVTVGTSGVAGCAATPSMCNNSTPGESSLTGGWRGTWWGRGMTRRRGWGRWMWRTSWRRLRGKRRRGWVDGELHAVGEPDDDVGDAGGEYDDDERVDADGYVGGRVCGHGGADVLGVAGDGRASDVRGVAGEPEPDGGRVADGYDVAYVGGPDGELPDGGGGAAGGAGRRGAGRSVAAGAAGAAAGGEGRGVGGSARTGAGIDERVQRVVNFDSLCECGDLGDDGRDVYGDGDGDQWEPDGDGSGYADGDGGLGYPLPPRPKVFLRNWFYSEALDGKVPPWGRYVLSW